MKRKYIIKSERRKKKKNKSKNHDAKKKAIKNNRVLQVSTRIPSFIYPRGLR